MNQSNLDFIPAATKTFHNHLRSTKTYPVRVRFGYFMGMSGVNQTSGGVRGVFIKNKNKKRVCQTHAEKLYY